MELNEKQLRIIKRKIAALNINDDVIDCLKEYQIQHVKNLLFVLQYGNACLDMSDTGTGKTFTTLVICRQLKLRPIIICPKNIISSWFEIADMLCVDLLGIANYELAKKGKYYTTLESFYDNAAIECPYIKPVYEKIIGTEQTKLQYVNWNIPNGTLIVFDEAHKAKNGIGTTKKTGISILMSSCKMFLDKTVAKYVIFLSASISDDIMCFDSIAYHLGFYEVYDFKYYTKFLETLGDDYHKQLNKILFPRYASRMRKESANFSKSNIMPVLVNVNQALANEIENEHKKMSEAIENLRNKTIPGSIYFVIMLRARQKIELLKIPSYADKIKERLDAGDHVVVFLNFVESKLQLAQLLLDSGIVTPADIDYIDGTNTAISRNTICKKFQNDELKVLVCNSASGGTSLSLHDINGKYPRSSIISPTHSAILLLQMLGRIDREGAKTDTLQQIIYVRSEEDQFSVEQKICDNLRERIKNINSINDGDLNVVNYI